MKIRIATRKSPLALWQARHVADRLRGLQPGLDVSLVERTTKGDRILDQALSKVGGKDLFVKEIEAALIDGDAEVAVHSLKDVPTEIPAGLEITAFPRREDPRDALVSRRGYTVETLPRGAGVGTSSLRRAAQLKARRPDVVIVPVRGNVQTRIAKLEGGEIAAVILALAGLKRMELDAEVTEILDPSVSLPAIGQGILAVETRANDISTNGLVSKIDHAATRVAAIAERAFLARLQGGCQIPIAGHARVSGDHFVLDGLVSDLEGTRVVRGSIEGAVSDARGLGIRLADELISRGADNILRSLRAGPSSSQTAS